MRLIDEDALKFLERYINNASPTGHEFRGQQIWLDYIKPYVDSHIIDSYGNVAGIINPGAEHKVVLEAHADEVSWLVNYIDENGFIHVIKNGGSDPEVAPSKHVYIHTDKGIVSGIFGWPAVHLRKDAKTENIEQKHLFIDCGCTSKEEVQELGVEIGDVVTFTDRFSILNEKFFVGRGLDNRIGGLIVAQVAKLLKSEKIKLDFSLYIVNAVQEEVGSQGAKMISETIQPDAAIITDVTHDTNTPYIDKRVHGDTACGKGPILPIAPSVHKGLLHLIIKTAEDNNIQYQRKAKSKRTGTDTEAISLTSGGVASVLVATPLRYMHTPVETVHIKDVENVIKLIYKTLICFKPKDFINKAKEEEAAKE